MADEGVRFGGRDADVGLSTVVDFAGVERGVLVGGGDVERAAEEAWGGDVEEDGRLGGEGGEDVFIVIVFGRGRWTR